MKIQPVITWQNGEQKEANNFVLSSSWDNFFNAASFNYQLQNIVEAPSENEEGYPTTVIISSDNLVVGSLYINGQDYQDWDASTNANQWAYEWAAAKLNLVLIPETV